jgi:hypothetical protein
VSKKLLVWLVVVDAPVLLAVPVLPDVPDLLVVPVLPVVLVVLAVQDPLLFVAELPTEDHSVSLLLLLIPQCLL